MEQKNSGISVFQRYLTVWVALCMVVGVLIGRFLPQIPDFLNRFEYARISIPMAILIWLMIYPMMMKVDFQSIKNVGKNPKGLFVTWVVNWLIKPFSMYAIASLFFLGVFKAFITPELAAEYLAGAVLLGAAPCTAMVFVWSTLTKGDPAYTVVQVATNDLIILVAFVPIVKLLLGVSNVQVPMTTLFLSVVLFVVIPLAFGILTRVIVTKSKGADYFENTFIHKFDGITTIGLLLTLILTFSFQGSVILENPLHILLIAVPFAFIAFLVVVNLLDNKSLNGIKAKKIGDGQHGTARWATRTEIKRTFIPLPFEPEKWRKGENLPTVQGTVVACRTHGKKTVALVDDGDVHTLMIGAAGVGKTAYFLYPNIELACASGMSFVSTDTKGDVARNYGTIAKKYYGYNVSVLDLLVLR